MTDSPIPGAADKITDLRRRHEQLAANIAHYEARVSRNAQELQLLNQRPSSRNASRGGAEDVNANEDDEAEMQESAESEETGSMTKQDLEAELAQVRELERKRKALEARVMGFESDLKGLA